MLRKVFLLIAFIASAMTTIPLSAQIYEANNIIGKYITATRTDAEGTRWKKKIPNGTKIEVNSRTVTGDSLSARDIIARFAYEGEMYATEARWLKFSDDNPEGTADIFADDDFSPTEKFVSERLAFTRFNPLSPLGHFLYSLTLPVLQFPLMLTAVIVLLRSTLRKSLLPFLLAVALQIYTVIMMGDDALWWCLPEYQGIGGAILGFIPLAVYLALELSYVILTATFSRTHVKLLPVIIAAILQFPAITLSHALTGNPWTGLAVVYAIPFIVNITKGGFAAAGDTLVLIIGVAGFFATLSATYFAGWQILASIVTICPLMAFFIAAKVPKGNFRNIYRDSFGNYVTGDGKIYVTRESAEESIRQSNRIAADEQKRREKKQRKD